MHFVDQAVTIIESYAEKIPLQAFVIIGAFVEEVLAPIPSPFVMTTAGTITAARGMDFTYIILLAFLGSIGKTFGAWILYFVTDKAEDVILGKFGRFLGVSHEDIEGIGKRFGKGWKDDVTLFFLRTLPVLPSAPISVGAGLIKLNVRTYVVSTFLGICVRNLIFLYFGYTGIETYKHLIEGFEGIQSIAEILIFLILGAIIAWAYWKRRKNNHKKADVAK